MTHLQELYIIEAILYYKKTDYLENLNYNFFNFPPAKIICYLLKDYISNYNKFPNKTELTSYLEDKLAKDEIDFPKDEKQKELELQKIHTILEFLDDKEDLKDKVLNEKQLKEEIQKLVVKNILRNNIERLKEVIKTGEKAENLLADLKTNIEKHSIIIDEGKTIDWFINLEKTIRKDVKETGYLFLDRNMDGGLGAGEIALLASSPGIGKTTFLTNLAFNTLELHDDTNVLFITLELTEEQIFARLLAIFFGISLSDFKTKTPKQIIQENLDKRLISFDEFKQIFSRVSVKYFAPATDINQITNYIKQFRKSRKNQPLMVFIDYLNEIDYPYSKEMWIKMEKISTLLDTLVVENDIHLWIACQAHSKPQKLSSNKKNQEQQEEQYSKFLFNIKDLYGSKIGISKKITFGLGLTFSRDTGTIYLSFFKNRILGKINEIALIKFDKNTYKLSLTDIDLPSSLNEAYNETTFTVEKSLSKDKILTIKEDYDFLKE